jgi:hypothetical protein
MRRLNLVLGLLLTAGVPFSFQAPQGGPNEVITEASIRGHMEFLAGDAMNGRGSGSHDEWVAAAYIASQFRRWGIEPLGDNGDYVQTVTVRRAKPLTTAPTLSASALRFRHGDTMLVQTLGTGGVSGPLLKLMTGATAPAGSVVLLPAGAVPDSSTAAAALVLSMETEQIRARWAQSAARLPAPAAALEVHGAAVPLRQARIVLSKDAYAAMSILANGTLVTFDADVKPDIRGATYNAVGRLTGSDPVRAGEVILLTAHLDHLGVGGNLADKIYNGADDDASGTTAVLELAEAIAKGPRPQRTVIFALFGSEEAGGFGASAFVGLPPVPLDHIITNLEFEMIGRPDNIVPAHTLWLTGYERTNLGPELGKQGARIVADPHPEQNFFTRSDNIQLARAGVVAQTVSSFGLHADYHRPSDEISKIDFPHMTESIQSMFAPVEWLANSAFKPEWLPGQRPN